MTRQEALHKLMGGVTEFTSEQATFNRMLLDALDRLGMLKPAADPAHVAEMDRIADDTRRRLNVGVSHSALAGKGMISTGVQQFKIEPERKR